MIFKNDASDSEARESNFKKTAQKTAQEFAFPGIAGYIFRHGKFIRNHFQTPPDRRLSG